jgi:hypothetical protein
MVEGICDFNPSNGFCELESSFDNENEFLPKSVKEWAGLKNSKGRFKKTSLVAINDLGKTFEEIAYIIEKNVDKL